MFSLLGFFVFVRLQQNSSFISGLRVFDVSSAIDSDSLEFCDEVGHFTHFHVGQVLDLQPEILSLGCLFMSFMVLRCYGFDPC